MIKDFGYKLLAQFGNSQGGGVTPGSPGPLNVSLPNPLKAQSVEQLLNGVAAFLLTIAVPIATIMIIIGGFQILTAAGNPEKVQLGRKTIVYAVIGLAIIALFRVLMALLAMLLGANIKV